MITINGPEAQQQYEFDFQFEDNPIWVRADVTIEEALQCIKTGLLRNVPVARVKLFAVGEEPAVTFVYDIVAAKSGGSVWSLV